jgi:periplasmic copper chaperone A
LKIRTAVRVPNERANPDTTEITVQFPENVISASFQPVPGWTRRVRMERLDEPVEQFGEQITERIAEVTWTGGTIPARRVPGA